MFGYIKGTIKIIESNYVIIDNNGIGYIIYVANPYSYEIDKDYTIYTYTFISENENTLYGFKSLEENKNIYYVEISKGMDDKNYYVPKVNNPYPSLEGYNYISNVLICKVSKKC